MQGLEIIRTTISSNTLLTDKLCQARRPAAAGRPSYLYPLRMVFVSTLFNRNHTCRFGFTSSRL